MISGRKLRQKRIRKRISGTKEVPRLCVFRSNSNMYAQLIDDVKGKTLVAFSTVAKGKKEQFKNAGTVKAAAALGEEFGKLALEKGFKKIVFDRAGYMYHGRVKALADGARKAGLQF